MERRYSSVKAVKQKHCVHNGWMSRFMPWCVGVLISCARAGACYAFEPGAFKITYAPKMFYVVSLFKWGFCYPHGASDNFFVVVCKERRFLSSTPILVKALAFVLKSSSVKQKQQRKLTEDYVLFKSIIRIRNSFLIERVLLDFNTNNMVFVLKYISYLIALCHRYNCVQDIRHWFYIYQCFTGNSTHIFNVC